MLVDLLQKLQPETSQHINSIYKSPLHSPIIHPFAIIHRPSSVRTSSVQLFMIFIGQPSKACISLLYAPQSFLPTFYSYFLSGIPSLFLWSKSCDSSHLAAPTLFPLRSDILFPPSLSPHLFSQLHEARFLPKYSLIYAPTTPFQPSAGTMDPLFTLLDPTRPFRLSPRRFLLPYCILSPAVSIDLDRDCPDYT